jgi:two-component sensor histidine kinase
MRDVLRLSLAAAAHAALAATGGVLALHVSSGLTPEQSAAVGTNWWFGAFLGALVVTALALGWRRPEDWRLGLRGWLSLASLLAATTFLSWAVFIRQEPPDLRPWYVYPALIWLAVAYRARGAAAGLIVVAAFAIWSATTGAEPVGGAFMPEFVRVSLAQQFAAITAFSTLLLAAAADERRGVEALRASETRLRESRATLQAVIENAPVGIIIAAAPDGRVTAGNRAAETILGHPPVPSPGSAGYGYYRARHADGRGVSGHEFPLARVFAGEPQPELECLYQRPDRREIWIRIRGAPVRDETGRLIGGVVAFLDVDAEKRAAERQALLVAELSHRVKNVLAVVQAIASQTLARSGSLDAFQTAFEGRLGALAAAHALLLRTNWTRVDLRDIVEAVLAPHRGAGAPARIEGEAVAVGPRQGVALVLILHELATNAAKYGALGPRRGRLSVVWERIGPQDAPRLRLLWREGGVLIEEPVKEGFGSRLVRRSAAHELGGDAARSSSPEGLTWRIEFPVEPPTRSEEGVMHR